jgi:hypothetical protein
MRARSKGGFGSGCRSGSLGSRLKVYISRWSKSI